MSKYFIIHEVDYKIDDETTFYCLLDWRENTETCTWSEPEYPEKIDDLNKFAEWAVKDRKPYPYYSEPYYFSSKKEVQNVLRIIKAHTSNEGIEYQKYHIVKNNG